MHLNAVIEDNETNFLYQMKGRSCIKTSQYISQSLHEKFPFVSNLFLSGLYAATIIFWTRNSMVWISPLEKQSHHLLEAGIDPQSIKPSTVTSCLFAWAYLSPIRRSGTKFAYWVFGGRNARLFPEVSKRVVLLKRWEKCTRTQDLNCMHL